MSAPAAERARGTGLWEIALALALAVAVAAACHAVQLGDLVGLINDDGVYALAARALHEGLGYVALNLPGHPPVPRYPIGFPALLALVLAGVHGAPAELARMQWVPPVSAGGFAFASWATLRRHLPGHPLAALAGAALVGFHPVTVFLGSHLMSDLPFATLALVGLWLAERGWRGGDVRIWGLAGLAIAAATLVRTAGVTLFVATGLGITLRAIRPPLSPGEADAGGPAPARRGAALGAIAFLGGAAVLVLPWLLYRAGAGSGGSYGSVLANAAGIPPARLLADLPTVATYFATSGVPALVAPAAFTTPNGLALVPGLALLALVATGVAVWLRRPQDGWTPIAPLYLAITAAMAFAWQFLFMNLQDQMMARLLLPVAPIALLAAGLGAATVARGWDVGRGWQRAIAAILVLDLLATGWLYLQQHQRFESVALPMRQRGDYDALFAAVRARTPPDAVCLGWNGAMTTFYTGRPCLDLTPDLTPERLHAEAGAFHVRYLLGTPNIVFPPGGASKALGVGGLQGGRDLSVELLNAYQQRFRGSLRLVWHNARLTFALFEVISPGEHGGP